MLKRDIWDKLIDWKNRDHHPLVIRGLRQIGKTYIVREFGKEFFESCIYIDLRANKTIHSAFEGDFQRRVLLLGNSFFHVENEALKL
ncbi:AAA domain-containing protein [Butyrivibrio fibrisolvens]|uniref:AAA domain-containing protein n=1 Tax=Butyrivibrio fibrisolvens TaxID=831 RepID=A0A1H9V1N5_BUTFI|nr:AAA family ATPase [Butyrivibrio fibrisolvens]SES15203.1 AAA domain-containing protein [Butyrivibrio fibrisolvens]